MEKAGKYEFVRKIGTGGYGVVYEGRDPFIKRRVAIKVCSSSEEEVRQRFYSEAEIVGNLEHRNITTVHDFGLEDGVPYLVQEYLTGEDLDHMIDRRDPLALGRKLDILAQVVDGLNYAHEQGVIHRDVKPGNVRILEDGRVKIMDFGIARLKDHKSSLTRTGTTVGTAAYLPPEQIRGEPTDHRADIFSFGVMAYELLAYQRPFDALTLAALLYKILGNEPQPLAAAWPEAPERLASLVHSCLEKDPERRSQSFAAVASELAAVRAVISADWGEESQSIANVAAVDADELQQRVRTALAAGDVSAAELEILRSRHGLAGATLAPELFERLLAEAAGARMKQGVERQRSQKVDDLLERARQLQASQSYPEALRLLHAARDLAPANTAVLALLAQTEASLEREGQAERARVLQEIATAIEAGNLKSAAAALAAAETAYAGDGELPGLRRRIQQEAERRQAESAAAKAQSRRVSTGSEMDPFVGSELLQALRRLRTTGGATLHLENLGIRLYLREGDLCLAAGDPLVRQVSAASSVEKLEAWLRLLQTWRSESVRVDPAPPASHVTLAVFTPLAPVLMAAVLRGRSTADLERDLIPADLEIAALSGRDLRSVDGLEPQDAFVLTRVESPQRMETLVGLTGLARDEVIRRVARLAALGWVKAIPPGTWSPNPVEESLPDRLSVRLLVDLEKTPLRLPVADHRQRLHHLLARFGGMTHYELLGLEPHAEDAKIHSAFVELARLVHPSHAQRLGLDSAEPMLRLMFERACEAYSVLTDRRQRDRYDGELGVANISPVSAEARATERRNLAHSYFEQAKARVRLEEYHFAIELLRQAVRADPRPEYWKLLATCLMRNSHWLGQAKEAARQSSRQRPADVELRVILGEIHEQMGEHVEATQQFREALEREPGNAAAEEGLARLAVAKATRPAPAPDKPTGGAPLVRPSKAKSSQRVR